MLMGRRCAAERLYRRYYKHNTIQQIRAFHKAASLGSFQRAAASLWVGQPAISLQVQALERELGVCLFRRHSRGVTVTDAGRVLFDLVAPILDAIDALPELLGERLKQPTETTVRLVASIMSVERLLPEVLTRFQSIYPHVCVQVVDVMPDQIPQMILSGEVEVGFGPAVNLPPDLDFKPCRTYGTVLLMRKDHPLASRRTLSLAEVFCYPLIIHGSRASRIIRLGEQLAPKGLIPQIRIETVGWASMCACVQQGLGIGILTEAWVDDTAPDALCVVSATELFGSTTYGILTRRGTQLSLQAKNLIREIKQVFGQGLVAMPSGPDMGDSGSLDSESSGFAPQ